MTDETTTVTLSIETSILEMLARRRGFATIAEYLVALVDKDDDLMWDEQFAATPPEAFEQMEKETLAEEFNDEDAYEQGVIDWFANGGEFATPEQAERWHKIEQLLNDPRLFNDD